MANVRTNFLKLERQDLHRVDSKWQDRFTEKACELIKLGATDDALAIALDVSLTTILRWKRDYPEFSERVMKEKFKTSSFVAFALYRSCIGYDYTETRTTVKSNGEVIEETFTKHKAGDPYAQMQWLQLRAREFGWSEDKTGNISGNTTININNLNQINLDSLNTEELKLALKLGMQQKQLGANE